MSETREALIWAVFSSPLCIDGIFLFKLFIILGPQLSYNVTSKLFYKAIKKIIMLPVRKLQGQKVGCLYQEENHITALENSGHVLFLLLQVKTVIEKNEINWLPASLKAPIFRIMTKLSVFAQGAKMIDGRGKGNQVLPPNYSLGDVGRC